MNLDSETMLTILALIMAFITFFGILYIIGKIFFKSKPKEEPLTNPPAYQMTLDVIEKKKVEDFNKCLNELSSRIEEAINRGEFSIKLIDERYNYRNYSDDNGKFKDDVYINNWTTVSKDVVKSIFKELRKRGFKVKHNYEKVTNHITIHLNGNISAGTTQSQIITTTISWEK